MRDAAAHRDRSMPRTSGRTSRTFRLEDDRAMQLLERLVAAMAIATVVLLVLAR
jgi:hypothetical protein